MLYVRTLRKSFTGRILRVRLCSTATAHNNTDMSEKALKRGDPLPPVTRNVMRFYNMRFCPFAQRTRMVLLHKAIPHEMVNVNLRYKPEWFLARNPLGLVPILECNDQIVYESRICDDYLDAEYPHHGNGPLYPSCPFERSQHNILMHHFDIKIPASIYGVMNPKKAEKARETMAKGLNIMEDALGDKDFFGGSKPCMVDFHAFPWFERFPAVTRLSKMVMSDPNEMYNPMPPEDYPRLTTWVARIQELPAVKQTLLPTEHHMEFMMKLKMRQPEYDIGLETTTVAARL